LVAKWLPSERLLVETDAPFLAPIPHRGKTGEPAFVADTARYVAQLRGVDTDILAKETSDNFYSLFSKAVR
jgi:TatD DNase family protein